MDTRDALLRKIIDHPDDDLPRLVFADWCDDQRQARRAEFIRRQVAGTLVTVGLSWLVELEHALGCQPHECQFSATPGEAAVTTPAGLRLTFRRGFVDSVRCPLGDWLAHGPRVVREHPVRGVWVTDREPIQHNVVTTEDQWAWWRYDYERGDVENQFHPPSNVPVDLFGLIPGRARDGDHKMFASRDAALAAISKACLAWAKSQAHQLSPA
jgi:uncharacterized protein (TIGR02996 family)